jgi:hypothetical protein
MLMSFGSGATARRTEVRPDGGPGATDDVPTVYGAKPEALVISAAEAALLGKLEALVPTPRSAKRLVNIYRMLRVSVPTDEADAFDPRGGREYEAVVVLLGVLVGLPWSVSEVFAAIVNAADLDDIWGVLVGALGEDAESVRKVETLRPSISLNAAGPFRRWVPRVARFSFRAGLESRVDLPGVKRR